MDLPLSFVVMDAPTLNETPQACTREEWRKNLTA